MTRVYVVVEGSTEESFVKTVLLPYLSTKDIFLIPIIVRTSKTGKGGGSSYQKIKNHILKLCRQEPRSYVTTIFDFYGFPSDAPWGIANTSNIHESIIKIESSFKNDINQSNFIPNLIIHEFEGLLFSNIETFKNYFNSKRVDSLNSETKAFESPEHINNSPETAPSKRILRKLPSYQKTYHGALISKDVGIDLIRKKCTHFSNWLKKIENLKPK